MLKNVLFIMSHWNSKLLRPLSCFCQLFTGLHFNLKITNWLKMWFFFSLFVSWCVRNLCMWFNDVSSHLHTHFGSRESPGRYAKIFFPPSDKERIIALLFILVTVTQCTMYFATVIWNCSVWDARCKVLVGALHKATICDQTPFW